MFCLFGTKFVKMFCGPMWTVAPTSQAGPIQSASHNTQEARVNIPGLGERTLERYIAQSGISVGAEVQVSVLDAASQRNPGARWWLKGDGCDIVEGIGTTMRDEWTGDVDLDDGELNKAYAAYKDLMGFYSSIGLGGNSTETIVNAQLQKCVSILKKDHQFITEALSTADKEYSDRIEKNSSEKLTRESGWKVEDLTTLLRECRQAIVEVQTTADLVRPGQEAARANVPQKLSRLRESLTEFTRKLQYQKRKPATHIFVMMISNELRNSKPYAIPIQCVPYHSINEATMRRLINNVLTLMTDRGMSVAGFTSNGEYNSMRNNGYLRPISVFRVRSLVRTKYSRMSVTKMTGMLTPLFANHDLVAKVSNPAVSTSLLAEIVLMQCSGSSWEDIVSTLRSRTVPTGYQFHCWKVGVKPEKESEADKLRSILAQLEFTQRVRQYDAEGVPFRSHLHVPETHYITGETFCEREDPAHVLKRIATCTRNGGPSGMKLERFQEALHDEQANLTYTALVGSRKQSVEDAERLLSSAMAKFMERHEYSFEADYINAVNGWRRACDERGLSESERSSLNMKFLNYILNDLMPWHKENRDFSLLEVNKDISSVCGFTREVLGAVVADIETTEWRRKLLSDNCLEPEHPRASTTDDVECFFSLLRDFLGKDFTLKQVKLEWRKLCAEFKKRLDPDLPFYYFTSSHDRFHEGERPSFEEPSLVVRRGQRVPRRESALYTSGRATLPVRGTLHVRAQYHNQPVEQPPPPSASSHLSDHTYA